jgi:hypothetical protein
LFSGVIVGHDEYVVKYRVPLTLVKDEMRAPMPHRAGWEVNTRTSFLVAP